MSLFVTSLNSGSNGNCYYVGNDREAILIDAGISCREIEKRMKRLGLSMDKVKAVFISHEHSDHISGVTTLTKRYQVPVYITSTTLVYSRLRLNSELVINFRTCEPISIGHLTIVPFPKLHDASDPYSFIVSCNKINVGIFTDIGKPCQQLIKHFKQCHAAFLETNYDDQMLDKGSYPMHLKRRIRGGMGHLSNKQALDLFVTHRPTHMSHLFLSHLSKNNNCPDLVTNLFNGYAGNVKMIVASRYEETAVYQIENLEPVDVPGIKLPHYRVASSQLAFSFA
jgi:phosphoribosyl 1,2-cyclic phosphodiesterase